MIDIADNILEEVLLRALANGGDFADIFIENRRNTNIHFSTNRVERAVAGTEFGAGVRLIFNGQSIYSYTNHVSREGLLRAADVVAAAASGGRQVSLVSLERRFAEERSPVSIHPETVPMDQKLELIRMANDAARGEDPLISQAELTYNDEKQEVLIANSDGLLVGDVRTRVRLQIVAVASREGEMQVGNVGPGACMGFEFFDTINVEEEARGAARSAALMVRSDYAPGGRMPVIIESGFGGVIFHEACGHGLEAYHVARNASAFAGKLGETIASPVVSAADDGTLENGWGSINVDDEGTPTQRTLLIDRGLLNSYLVDMLSGRKLGLESTGSARRQSYRFAPVSRMRNTFILPGLSSLEEMIAATDRGLLARRMGGGSVETATGDFNFAVLEGYLIESGRVGKPVRGATLIGNGPEVLKRIDMVSGDLEQAQGMCGASSGMIPVNVGQPAVRVTELTVGGR